MYLPCAISGFSAREKRDGTSQQPFRLEKGVFSQNKKNVHAREYINHNKVTGSLTDKQRRRNRFDGAFYSSTCSKKQKTYRAIKAASIAVSAGLGAGREIVTLCVRGALLTTRPGVCHGVAEGAPMERDTGRNTVKSVQGQIRLAHWNRWSFIGCVIMSRILGNWMQHVHTCTCAYNHTQGTFRAKVARRFCAGYQKEPRLPHAWVTCNVRMHHTCS